MKNLSDYNPVSQFVFFALATGTVMFVPEPVITMLSLIGAVIFYTVRNKGGEIKFHLYSLLLFVIMSIINPLFNHAGETVLFVMNDNPVTMEATLYGINMSACIVSIIYWFRSFSQIFTTDRLLYLFGIFTPKIALILSCALRYIPLFRLQNIKVENAQKTLGLYKDGNLADAFKGKLRVFSVMTTWALENGIITADSMSARGYGERKRTRFSLFKFRAEDLFLIIFCVLLFLAVIFGVTKKDIYFVFYPNLKYSLLTGKSVIIYICYFCLVFLPTILQVKEDLKWKYLRSKI